MPGNTGVFSGCKLQFSFFIQFCCIFHFTLTKIAQSWMFHITFFMIFITVSGNPGKRAISGRGFRRGQIATFNTPWSQVVKIGPFTFSYLWAYIRRYWTQNWPVLSTPMIATTFSRLFIGVLPIMMCKILGLPRQKSTSLQWIIQKQN